MSRVAEILLVEDNPADVLLLSEALESGGWALRLHVVEDGVEALDYLCRRAAHADAPRPDLILLDLNTPKKSGREVLAEIRSDPALDAIPVVIVSGSPWEQKTLVSLGIPAERYIVKPATFSGYLEVARRIHAIGLQTSRGGI